MQHFRALSKSESKSYMLLAKQHNPHTHSNLAQRGGATPAGEAQHLRSQERDDDDYDGDADSHCGDIGNFHCSVLLQLHRRTLCSLSGADGTYLGSVLCAPAMSGSQPKCEYKLDTMMAMMTSITVAPSASSS